MTHNAKQTRVKPFQSKPPLKTAVSSQTLLNPIQQTIEMAEQLQQTIGNQAIGRLLIQPKLTLGSVGDKYEQEADAVAKQVVSHISTSDQSTVQPQEDEELQMMPITAVQRQEDEEMQLKSETAVQRQEDEEMQLKGETTVQRQSNGGSEISADIEQSIQSARGSGQPLADTIRAPMENAFGTDFSSVNIHTNSQSNTLNHSLQARAFTTGQDVFFRQGEYNPSSSGGQELLAHELTHVVQQTGGAVHKSPQIQGAQTNHSSKTSIIQRYLDIKGTGVFNMGNFEDFKKHYTGIQAGNMIKNIRDAGGMRYDTIEDALASPDVCMIYYDEGEKEFYPEFVENERIPLFGGATRHVLGHASYAARPAAGFEELQMTGLHNCIAVAVETKDHLGVSGIAVSHFATPTGIDAATKTLTAQGMLALNGFQILVPGGTAHILWNDESPETRDDVDYTSGQRAANIAAFYLHSLGIKTVDLDPLHGGSCKYRLSHDGVAGWHGL